MSSGTVLDAPAPIAEPRLRLGEEAGGDVGVHVVELPLREHRQHRCSGRSGARADLDHAQAAALGQRVHKGPDRHPRASGSPAARYRCLEVQIGGGGFSAAEQESERVIAAAQDIGKGAAGPAKEPDFGPGPWEYRPAITAA